MMLTRSPGFRSNDVPLDPASPWRKFQRDAAQTGLGPFTLTDDGAPAWSYRTGKGIFSSPVVGGDGTVCVGSADRSFYALTSGGALRWSFATGEIIDAAALLDDRGRVYVASGDGHLYALDAATGDKAWTFAADDPAETSAFINCVTGPGKPLPADGAFVQFTTPFGSTLAEPPRGDRRQPPVPRHRRGRRVREHPLPRHPGVRLLRA